MKAKNRNLIKVQQHYIFSTSCILWPTLLWCDKVPFRQTKSASPVCLLAPPTINHAQWQVDYDSRCTFTPSSEESKFPKKVELKRRKGAAVSRKASIVYAEELQLYVKWSWGTLCFVGTDIRPPFGENIPQDDVAHIGRDRSPNLWSAMMKDGTWYEMFIASLFSPKGKPDFPRRYHWYHLLCRVGFHSHFNLDQDT